MRFTKKDKKVLVLGAGIGGLLTAINLSENGCDVTVVEKRGKDELGYPWCDSVKTRTFSNVGLSLPSGICSPKQVLRFIGPDGRGEIKQPDRAEKALDVNRTALIKYLTDCAEKTCDVRYETSVKELITSERVEGAVCGGEEIFSDIVIDSSGVFSPFRKEVPKKFFIDGEISGGDYLEGYRAFFKKQTNVKFEPRTYLLPDGLKGISWCKDSAEETEADVFCGSLGGLSDKEKARHLDFLRKHNLSLTGDEIFSRTDFIPVRCPIGTFVADGYAAVGNSACMTRPLCDSGIETSLRAAKMLTKAVISADECTAAKLWRYQRDFNLRYGSDFYLQNVVRKWAQNISPDDLAWAFTSGVLNANVIAIATADIRHINDFKMDDIVITANLAKSRKDLVKEVEQTVKKAVLGKALVLSAPVIYGYDSVARWKDKYDAYLLTE